MRFCVITLYSIVFYFLSRSSAAQILCDHHTIAAALHSADDTGGDGGQCPMLGGGGVLRGNDGQS